MRTLLTASVVALAVFGIGMVVTNWDRLSATPIVGRLAGTHFAICGTIARWNCVVDGDTFWRNGSKIRIADIDTPEVFSPQCPSEYDLGMQATRRLRDLLNEGQFDLQPIGDRDEDQYGRKLRVAVRNGQSIGDQLVNEGLARTWSGRREPWC
ncbi:MAG TPA: thermonuclease family protein [Novosphingobium sp.]|nr:thermonuclease family protein [Novosphingobium sp.]